MHLLEPGLIYVEVNLRGGQARVTEEFLDDSQIGATTQHMSREAVPQRVRRELPVDIGMAGVLANDPPDVRSVQRTPRARQEHHSA